MTLSPSDFDFFRQHVRQSAAIVLEGDKLYLAEARLTSLARKEGFTSPKSLLEGLRQGRNRDLSHKVVEAITINETSFFRDIHCFEAVRKQVLPDLLRGSPQRSLNIWSAACASGQEPYSLAMLVSEYFPNLLKGRCSILATDLSSEMIERARQGQYTQLEINRGLPARLLVKHFQRLGAAWQLKDEIRRLVDFRLFNLAVDWPKLPAMDVVFLRNVLIYFDLPTKRVILGKVRQLLRQDGWLFLGGPETTLNVDDAYQRVQLEGTVAFRPNRV
jgi:chemotaxis protein methyltransferase CheR